MQARCFQDLDAQGKTKRWSRHPNCQRRVLKVAKVSLSSAHCRETGRLHSTGVQVYLDEVPLQTQKESIGFVVASGTRLLPFAVRSRGSHPNLPSVIQQPVGHRRWQSLGISGDCGLSCGRLASCSPAAR